MKKTLTNSQNKQKRRGMYTERDWVLFPIFIFVVVIAFCTVVLISGGEPPCIHSLISLLSCSWYWLWIFFGRGLQNNSLKDLPEDIFRNNHYLWHLWVEDLFISLFITIPKLPISQSEAVSAVLISWDLIWLRNLALLAGFGYGKCLIVPFWLASTAYQARLLSQWVFRPDYHSPKYELTILLPDSLGMPPHAVYESTWKNSIWRLTSPPMQPATEQATARSSVASALYSFLCGK